MLSAEVVEPEDAADLAMVDVAGRRKGEAG